MILFLVTLFCRDLIIACESVYTYIGSFPLQIETTSEVYVGDFGLRNISRLHKCHHNRTPQLDLYKQC